MELLGNLARDKREFDFQEVMGRFLFCLFLQIAFHEEGLALDLLSGDPVSLETKPDYIRAFDQATVCMLLFLLIVGLADLAVFDRRRRDPLWKITERLSGEDKVTKRAVDLFYGKIDGLIMKRLEAMRNDYKPNPDAGVDLLDIFLQSTTDVYKLGGMVFSFLSAGRTYTSDVDSRYLLSCRRHNSIQHLLAYEGNPPRRQPPSRRREQNPHRGRRSRFLF